MIRGTAAMQQKEVNMFGLLAFSALGLIVVVAILVALAFWPARVAGRKGHSFVGYFIFGPFFFPLALIFAYAVEDRFAAGPA